MSQIVSCIFQLEFHGPLHIANPRAEYDSSERVLHSDTLYAAIMSAWAMLDLSEWITPEPTFALSSLFPYKQKQNGCQYFLPKPVGVFKANNDQSIRKKIKKVRYIDLELFAQWAKGFTIEANADHVAGDFYVSKLDAETEEEKKQEQNKIRNYISSEVYPRVRVPRMEGKDAEPYYIERIWFAEGCGLYCIFIGTQEDYDKVKTALNFLQDEGIGTDRHVGNGLFKLNEANLPNEFHFNANDHKYLVNLSLFCPESVEQLKNLLPQNDNHISYELVRRGGWITTEPYLTLRKKHVTMFREGSVFATTDNLNGPYGGFLVAGKTHKVHPWNDDQLHKIYRSGRAIFVPVKID